MDKTNHSLECAVGAVAIGGGALAAGLHLFCWFLLQQFSVIYADMFHGKPLPFVLVAKPEVLIFGALVPLGIIAMGFLSGRPEQKLYRMTFGMGVAILLFLFVVASTLTILTQNPSGLGQFG